MNLTKEQLQIIENYLQKKKFEYIDLKYEVLDHIISDIESLLDKNISFDIAFKFITLKWDKYFRETSSFYFGLMFHASKLVVNKAKKIFKSYYFLFLSLYFLPIVFNTFFKIRIDKNIVDFINEFVLLSSLVLFVYILIIARKIVKTKIKTTYSFIIKTQYLGATFLVIGSLNQVFDKEGFLSGTSTSMLLAGYFVVFICHYFYKKHKETIVKYKLT
jgi:hypothetical protein